MAIQFILGRSGSGKSYQLYHQLIQQSMERPEQQFYLVVPEQFTMQTQRDLVEMHPNHGISNIDVVSFLRLAYRVMEEQGGIKQTVLEDTGKSLLVRRVITEKQDQLLLFQNYAGKPGYISEIKSLLSEFFQYNIDPDTLEQMIRLAEEKPMLQRKLQDMLVIYEGFEELLAEKYITAEEILDALIQQLEHTHILDHTVLALDGFTGFTPVQYQLLRKLMRICKEIYITVTIDPMESPAMQQEEIALFHNSREMIDKIIKIAGEEGVTVEQDWLLNDPVPRRFQESPQLACLEHNLFRFSSMPYEEYQKQFPCAGEKGGIRLFAAHNMQGEVEFALEQIAGLIRKEGYRYREIGVVTGDIKQYGRLFERACAKAKIPCFIDYKKDIAGNPLVELLRTVLQLFLRDFDYESVFRYLRCGLVDMDRETVDLIENYVLAMGIKGLRRWKPEWTKVRREFAVTEEEQEAYLLLMNDSRQYVLDSITSLQKTFRKKKGTVTAYCTALHTFLVEQQIYKKLKAYEERFQQEGELLLAKEYAQVYELVLEILDKMVQLLGNEEVTLQEFSDLLENGFAEVKVGLIPPGVDQIVVGDIERTRLKDIRALFFLGVNEGMVPSTGEKGGMLSDMERELLAANQISLAPTARQTVFTQQFYLYLNLTKPKEYLYISYHKADGEGKPVLPSGLIRNLRQIFPELTVQQESRIVPNQPLFEEQMEEMLGVTYGKTYLLDGIRQMGEIQLEDWWKELLSFYVRQDNWTERRKPVIEGAGFINEENPLSKEVASALYGRELKNSVTRVEKYAACAFAHFIQYGICLRERYEFQFSGLDLGNVFHQVLSIFPDELNRQGQSWRTADREQMDLVVDLCLDKVKEEYGNDVLESSEKNKYMVERMARILKRTIWAVANQIKASAFEPEGYELKFQYTDGLDAARMDLGEDRVLRLKGQIDRMDLCEEKDKVYVKVLDYKSGKMQFDIQNLYYGLQMQLVVYMNAAVEMEQEKHKGKPVVPAGIFYYNIDDPIVERKAAEQVDQALLKELRMNGLVNGDPHVISLLDQAFGDTNPLNPSVKSLYIPVETVSSGECSKRSSVASEQEFSLMGNYANHKITKDAGAILDGDIAIAPYRMGNKTACDYCAYRTICKFDTKLPGNQYRDFKSLTNTEVWNAMKEEVKGEEKGGKKDVE